jgi:hypothetical protein
VAQNTFLYLQFTSSKYMSILHNSKMNLHQIPIFQFKKKYTSPLLSCRSLPFSIHLVVSLNRCPLGFRGRPVHSRLKQATPEQQTAARPVAVVVAPFLIEGD